MSKVYNDDIQKSIDVLKEKPSYIDDGTPTAKDVVLDILFFFLTGLLGFGWLLLVLLIISFVALSYLHFEFEKMLMASVIFGIVLAVIYAFTKIKKYRRK